jgi:hypothetical protein
MRSGCICSGLRLRDELCPSPCYLGIYGMPFLSMPFLPLNSLPAYALPAYTFPAYALTSFLETLCNSVAKKSRAYAYS